jgi:hypothetical protein
LCINSLAPLGQRQLNLFQIASEYDSYPATSSENNLVISEMHHTKGVKSVAQLYKGVNFTKLVPQKY